MSIPNNKTYDQYMRELNASVREIKERRAKALVEYRKELVSAQLAMATIAVDELHGVIALYPNEDPTCCPICGSECILVAMTPWTLQSIEDPLNKCVISEHQCNDCHASFWV